MSNIHIGPWEKVNGTLHGVGVDAVREITINPTLTSPSDMKSEDFNRRFTVFNGGGGRGRRVTVKGRASTIGLQGVAEASLIVDSLPKRKVCAVAVGQALQFYAAWNWMKANEDYNAQIDRI
jgi:hypothetical protein